MAHLILQLGAAPVIPFLVGRRFDGGPPPYRKRPWPSRRRPTRTEQHWCVRAYLEAACARPSQVVDDALDYLTMSPRLLAVVARQPPAVGAAVTAGLGR